MSVLGVVLQFLVVSRAYPDSNVLSDTEHVEAPKEVRMDP